MTKHPTFLTLMIFGAAFTAAIVARPALAQGPEALAQKPEISYNATLTSNYIFDGITQTSNSPALQLGADVAFNNGFYLGTWTSNVDFDDDTNYEVDFYAGFSGVKNGIGYDIGYVAYLYDGDNDYNLDEAYASLSAFDVTFTIAVQTRNDGEKQFNNLSYNLGWEKTLSDYTFGVRLGQINFDKANEDGASGERERRYDYLVTVSRAGFTLGLSDTNLPDTDPDLTFSYTHNF